MHRVSDGPCIISTLFDCKELTLCHNQKILTSGKLRTSPRELRVVCKVYTRENSNLLLYFWSPRLYLWCSGFYTVTELSPEDIVTNLTYTYCLTEPVSYLNCSGNLSPNGLLPLISYRLFKISRFIDDIVRTLKVFLY